MRTLVIYDSEGYIISSISGDSIREPSGIPFVWIDVPDGKRLKTNGEIGVNVSSNPHRVLLEDVPLSEVDSLSLQFSELQYQLMMNGVL